MSKTTTEIKWTRKGGNGYSAYKAYINGIHYMVERAPYSGWQVLAAKPGEHWQHKGYLRTLADCKEWAEGESRAVAA